MKPVYLCDRCVGWWGGDMSYLCYGCRSRVREAIREAKAERKPVKMYQLKKADYSMTVEEARKAIHY